MEPLAPAASPVKGETRGGGGGCQTQPWRLAKLELGGGSLGGWLALSEPQTLGPRGGCGKVRAAPGAGAGVAPGRSPLSPAHAPPRPSW